jgi:hypothetical protein
LSVLFITTELFVSFLTPIFFITFCLELLMKSRLVGRFMTAVLLCCALVGVGAWTTLTGNSSQLLAQSSAVATTLQVIHNAADQNAANVGVWVGLPPAANGQRTFLNAIPSFSFRTATAALPALGTISLGDAVGAPLAVNITGGGATAATPAVASFAPVTLSRGANIVIANGLVSNTGFAPNPDGRSTAFTLSMINDPNPVPADRVRLIVFHGATDAPRVDIFARGVGVLGTVAFRDWFTVDVPVGDYTIDVRLPGTTAVVASYLAQLQSLGLAGQRVVVSASGFLSPAQNRGGTIRNGQAFGLFAAAGTQGTPVFTMLSSTVAGPVADANTSVQLIHNAADTSARNVGVWLGVQRVGMQTGFVNAIPRFGFRTATPALTGLGEAVPSFAATVGALLTANVTAPSTTSSMPAIASFPNVMLGSGANIIIANGVVAPANYAPNPDGRSTAFTLSMINDATVVPRDRTRLVVFHGATDAPRVEVFVRGVGVIGTFSFREWFTVDVPVSDYTIDVRLPGTTTIVASYTAPLSSLGTAGQRVVVSASGFLNPAANRNGQPFGLFAAVGSMSATPVFTLLPTAAPPPPPPVDATTLHIIHNAADTSARNVGVWVGLPPTSAGTTFINPLRSFGFRTATPALTGLGEAVPSLAAAVGASLTLNVTGPNAAMAMPAIASFPNTTLSMGANIVIANGLVMPANYAPNPDGRSTAFTLSMIRDAAPVPANRVRLIVFHGATDAPRVDIFARGVGVLGTVAFRDWFTVDVPVNDYAIDIRLPGTETIVASFSAPLRALGVAGQRVVVSASGFLNPARNRGGQPFGLFAAVGSMASPAVFTMLPTIAPIPPLERTTTLQVLHNAADRAASNVGVWVGLPPAANGQRTFLNAIPSFIFRTATAALPALGSVSLGDAVGAPLAVNITGGGAMAATPAVASFAPVVLGRGANIVIANGLVGNTGYAPNPEGRSTAFTLSMFNDTLTVPADRVRLVVFHGATDAPRVDVFARGAGVLGTVAFRDWFTVDVPVNDYAIDIRLPGTTTVVASFSAPLRTLGVAGQRVVVAASGFLNPAGNRGGSFQNGTGFGLFAAVGNQGTPTFLLLPSIPAPSGASKAAFGGDINGNTSSDPASTNDTPNTVLANSANTVSTDNVLRLHSAAPNPSTGFVTVRYAAEKAGTVTMTLVNTLGMTVMSFPSEVRSAGTHDATLNLSALAVGSYQLVVTHNERRVSTPIMVTR